MWPVHERVRAARFIPWTFLISSPSIRPLLLKRVCMYVGNTLWLPSALPSTCQINRAAMMRQHRSMACFAHSTPGSVKVLYHANRGSVRWLRLYQGLYRGYKIRNARLNALAESPPSYLASNATPLANLTFTDVKSEATLRELHSYLTLRYALLDRVIRARKIHHTRFFSMNME